MKKHFNILSAMLTILLLFSMTVLFASCGEKEEEEGEETTREQIAVDTSLPDLEIKDFGGYELKILWPKEHADGHFKHNEIAVEEADDVINTAVRNRNLIVESNYNVKITSVLGGVYGGEDGIVTIVDKEYNAGESSYDALCTSIKFMNKLAVKGALKDYGDISAYDEAHPWWNHNLMKGFSIGTNRYFGAGDIIYSDDFYPYCTYVNTTVSENYGINEDYYQLVKDKKWTLEKFHTLAAQVAGDGDGQPDVWSADDMNGAIINSNFSRATYYSAGEGMITLDSEGYPTWNMTVAKTQPILEKIISTVFTDNACIFATDKLIQGQTHAQTELSLFTGGKSLFLVEELIISERITQRDVQVDFMLMPFPLYDEESEYTSVLNDAVVVSIPALSQDFERTGLVLSAMGRESVNTLTPAFFETVLTYRYMQNVESVETLQTILASTVAPDVATIQDWGGFMSGFKALAQGGLTNFSSFYQENISKANKELDNYITILETHE